MSDTKRRVRKKKEQTETEKQWEKKRYEIEKDNRRLLSLANYYALNNRVPKPSSKIILLCEKHGFNVKEIIEERKTFLKQQNE